MAFSSSMVWHAQTDGSDTNNGGGFDPTSGVPGTNYSQQAAAQVNYTDLVIDAAVNTSLTSAAFPFTSVHVGNILVILSGTGFTAQRLQIMSVAAGVATVDKSAGTLGSTGGTGNLGGSLATPGKAGSLAVTGNGLWIKYGTHLITSASNNVAGGCVSWPAQINGGLGGWIKGYQATPGDSGSRPTLQASGIATFTIITTGLGNDLRNVIVDGQSLTSSRGINATNGRAYKCKVINCTNLAIVSGEAWFCEINGCSVGTVALVPVIASFCYSHHNDCPGISVSSVANYCISAFNTGANGHGFSGNGRYFNCVSYGNAGDGHRLGGLGFTLASNTIINCIFWGNGGYGINVTTVDSTVFFERNFFGNNTLGATNGITIGNISGSVTLTIDPFVNAAGGDFSLNSTIGGGILVRGEGLPGSLLPGLSTTAYLDGGAAQHGDPADSAGVTTLLTRIPGVVQPQTGDSYPFANRTVIRGTVGAVTTPSTTAFTPSALSPAGVAADQFKGRVLIFDNATATTALRGQATDITASSAAALPLLTFTALTTAPSSGDTFSVV